MKLILSIAILLTLCGASDKTSVPNNVYHSLADCGILYESAMVSMPIDDYVDYSDDGVEVDEIALEYLACAIYCEAGADYIADETRYMVGDVILNRVMDDRFPDTVEDVLLQRGQYGRYYWTGIVWPSRAQNDSESRAVDRAYQTARDLLTDSRHSSLYGKGYIWQSEHRQSKDSIYQDGIWFGR